MLKTKVLFYETLAGMQDDVLIDMMLSSGKIPVVKLEHIFRQTQGNRIIMNTHRNGIIRL